MQQTLQDFDHDINVEHHTAVEGVRKQLKSIRKNVYKVYTEGRRDSINWLKEHIETYSPGWMKSSLQSIDSVLHYIFYNYLLFIRMPQVQKLLWAGFLFILGVSGFCVSKGL